MNILVINRNAFGQDDVVSIFRSLGHNVGIYDHKNITDHRHEEIEKELLDIIAIECSIPVYKVATLLMNMELKIKYTLFLTIAIKENQQI